MPQLYEVAFSAHYPHHVDAGRVLVIAPNQEAAIDVAAQLLELPRSSTQAVVTRVRGLYVVERREISKDQAKPKKKAPPEGLTKYAVMLEYQALARDEAHALRKLAGALAEKLQGQPVRYFKLEVMPLTDAARAPAMEQVETYRPKSFIGGMRKS